MRFIILIFFLVLYNFLYSQPILSINSKLNGLKNELRILPDNKHILISSNGEVVINNLHNDRRIIDSLGVPSFDNLFKSEFLIEINDSNKQSSLKINSRYLLYQNKKNYLKDIKFFFDYPINENWYFPEDSVLFYVENQVFKRINIYTNEINEIKRIGNFSWVQFVNKRYLIYLNKKSELTLDDLIGNQVFNIGNYTSQISNLFAFNQRYFFFTDSLSNIFKLDLFTKQCIDFFSNSTIGINEPENVNRQFYVPTWDGKIINYDFSKIFNSNFTKQSSIHSSFIRDIEVANNKIISGACDNLLNLSSIDSLNILETYSFNDWIEEVEFSTNGKYAALVSWNKKVYILDLNRKKIIKRFSSRHLYLPRIRYDEYDNSFHVLDVKRMLLIKYYPSNNKTESFYFNKQHELIKRFRFFAPKRVFKNLQILDYKISKSYFAILLVDKILVYKRENSKYLFPIQGSFKDFVFDSNRVYCFSNYSLTSYDILNQNQLWNVQYLLNDFDYISSSKDGLVLGSRKGLMKFFNPFDGQFKFNFFIFNDGNYLFSLADGNYFGSKKAVDYAIFKYGVNTYSSRQIDLFFNRPDKVLSTIYGNDSAVYSFKPLVERLVYKRFLNSGFPSIQGFYPESAPKLKILNFDSLVYLEKVNSKINLDLFVEDSLSEIYKIHILINGIPVYGNSGFKLDSSSKLYHNSIELKLNTGINNIEVYAENIIGYKSLKEELVLFNSENQAGNETIWFIGIGINNYFDSTLNLKYSTQDIYDLAQAFKDSDSLKVKKIFLTNEMVNRENVLKLRDSLMNSSINDRVIVSFSGHGFVDSLSDYYLSTYKINSKDPSKAGILFDDFVKIFDSIPARKRLLFLDACNSGQIDKSALKLLSIEDSTKITGIKLTEKGYKILQEETDSLGLKKDFTLLNELFLNLSFISGINIISASVGDQFAYEMDALENGVFTYALIKALNEKKGTDLKLLYEFVEKEVLKISRGMQKPTFRAENYYSKWGIQ